MLLPSTHERARSAGKFHSAGEKLLGFDLPIVVGKFAPPQEVVVCGPVGDRLPAGVFGASCCNAPFQGRYDGSTGTAQAGAPTRF